MSKSPSYFKLATLTDVDKQNKVMYLDICSQSMPATQCGNGCTTNMKAAHLITEKIGLNAPFTKCASHAASGTVRLCTSEAKSDGDAKALYDNLKHC